MRTLLEEHPTLLGEEEIASLMDKGYCKDVLGLKLSNLELLRDRDQGRMVGSQARYWKPLYAGKYYVCSQWWRQHNRANARALSKFVSELARRKPEHAGSRALLQYVEALDRCAAEGEVDLATAPGKRALQVRLARRKAADWPVWPTPSDEDLRELAQAMTPFVRFLDPGIVSAVVEDNRRMGAEWSSRLAALGINPDIYLWEDSPCAFPGIRRHVGNTEKAGFRKRATATNALALDDNDYPKHLWAFVFTGTYFRNRGPDGYQLAHLLDHKEHKNRWREELDIPPDTQERVLPYGLFTSAANLAYVPRDFLKPTDFSAKLRSLIQRRALQLYGNICCLVPPPYSIKPCEDQNWLLDNFQWSTPVGGMDNISDFREFRRERMEELFKKRQAALRFD